MTDERIRKNTKATITCQRNRISNGRRLSVCLHMWFKYEVKFSRVFHGYPSVHGAVFWNRKSSGPVRCGFKKAKMLWCGSVRFSDIVSPTERCGAVICPTVRFGAVLENKKSYGAFRCCDISCGPVRCGFKKSRILRCGSVRF